MHARVMTGLIQPGKMDEMISIYRDSILPVAKEQQGFKGIILLTDSHTNKIISISLWETEAYMKAGETSGYLQQQIGQIAPTLATPSVREAYEVSVHV